MLNVPPVEFSLVPSCCSMIWGSRMGCTGNGRDSSLLCKRLRDMGHVHPGVCVVRLGGAGYDGYLSIGSDVGVCAAFPIVSLDAAISDSSSMRVALFTIRLFALFFSSSTRRICMFSVAVNSFR